MANVIQTFPAGAGDSSNKTISKADFDNLTPAEQDNGTAYFVPDADIVTNFTVMGNRFDKANIYTADERMIGSWMGKPLYQRTVDCGAGPNATIKSVPCGINNLDKIVDIKGIICSTSTSDVWFKQVGNADTSLPYTINIDYNNGNIRINSGNNYSNGNVYVTLQYIKTSDGTVNISTGNDYSTDEQIIGTWIDGKKLYQRVFNTTSLQSDDNWHTIATISSVSFSIIKNIICIDSLGNTGIDTSFNGTSYMQVRITSSGELQYALKYNVSEVYIIVQYTKTED